MELSLRWCMNFIFPQRSCRSRFFLHNICASLIIAIRPEVKKENLLYHSATSGDGDGMSCAIQLKNDDDQQTTKEPTGRWPEKKLCKRERNKKGNKIKSGCWFILDDGFSFFLLFSFGIHQRKNVFLSLVHIHFAPLTSESNEMASFFLIFYQGSRNALLFSSFGRQLKVVVLRVNLRRADTQAASAKVVFVFFPF